MTNNNIKVSVIIPVYNTEEYVRQAVNSIREQTLCELEIIIVNDGSTDGSLQILEELAAEDERIQVYSQENQGLSTTRNFGLTHATGEYVYFMDSDDILEKDTLELCFLKCKEKELDFVFFDAVSFCEEPIPIELVLNYQRTKMLQDGKTYTGYEAFNEQITKHCYTPSTCLNFIQRSFLEKQQLGFYPGIIHEDQLFTTLLYLKANRTACIQRTFFHRRLRKDSIMTRNFSWQNLKGYFTVADETLRYAETQPSIIRKSTHQYLWQMLNAAVWQAHVFPLKERLKLTFICLQKYRKHVSLKTLGILVIKSYFRSDRSRKIAMRIFLNS